MWNKHNNINSEEYLYLSVKLFIEQGRGGRGCHRRNDLFFFFFSQFRDESVSSEFKRRTFTVYEYYLSTNYFNRIKLGFLSLRTACTENAKKCENLRTN